MKFTDKLQTVLDTTPTLIKNLQDHADLTQIEKNFLALHYLCGTADIADVVREHKAVVLNGGLDTVLRWLLTTLTHAKIDRWLAGTLCGFLCIWELYVSYVLFTQDTPPNWFSYPWIIWLSFGAVLGAYIVPILAFAVGEIIMLLIKNSVKRWTSEENVRQKRAADAAAVPNGVAHT